MALRILVISNLYPDAHMPTFGTFIEAHVKALAGAGVDVDVAAIRGVAVHSDVVPKYLRLLAIASLHVMRSVARRARPHVVEAHIAYPTGLVAWPLARLAGARLVLYCHGADVNEVGVRSRAHHGLARFLFRRADLLVANSRHTQGVLEDRYGVSPSRIVVWSPGIDIDLFHPNDGEARCPDRVLYVGRLARQKGIDVLIEAIARIGDPQLHLRVVGSGPVAADLERLALARDVSVTFIGPLPPALVAQEMSRAAILVVPSVETEGLGLVALEGLASGSLVVASSVGGLRESVIPGVTGWLVTPGDVLSLADALAEARALVAQPDDPRLLALRRAGWERARSHDISRIAANTVKAYAGLVARPGRSSHLGGGA